jgi:hypothetical protein
MHIYYLGEVEEIQKEEGGTERAIGRERERV